MTDNKKHKVALICFTSLPEYDWEDRIKGYRLQWNDPIISEWVEVTTEELDSLKKVVTKAKQYSCPKEFKHLEDYVIVEQCNEVIRPTIKDALEYIKREEDKKEAKKKKTRETKAKNKKLREEKKRKQDIAIYNKLKKEFE